MRRFTIRILAFVLSASVLRAEAQAGTTARGQTDSPPVPTQESVNKAQAKEYQLYQERLAVVFKLRAIALETRDEALNQKAEQLEAMAWKIYDQAQLNFRRS